MIYKELFHFWENAKRREYEIKSYEKGKTYLHDFVGIRRIETFDGDPVWELNYEVICL